MTASATSSRNSTTWPPPGWTGSWSPTPRLTRSRSGSWQLTAVPEGCERVVKINITVRVPVVGGRIERQIGAELRSNYETAAQFAQHWLAEHA
ncbi:MAG: DUF2505 family protein [Oligoflexia bacterium]|nr:DUF2505 family protein [Oligoflexia bacterium]